MNHRVPDVLGNQVIDRRAMLSVQLVTDIKTPHAGAGVRDRIVMIYIFIIEILHLIGIGLWCISIG